MIDKILLIAFILIDIRWFNQNLDNYIFLNFYKNMPKENFRSKGCLGKTLQNKQKERFVNGAIVNGVKHTTDIVDKGPGLKSILDQNSIEEFMQFAQMSSKVFEAERRHGGEVISQNTVIPS